MKIPLHKRITNTSTVSKHSKQSKIKYFIKRKSVRDGFRIKSNQSLKKIL